MNGRKFVLTLALCFAMAGISAAQSSNQSVTINVNEVNALSTSGAVILTITSATAGDDLDDATDASTTYSITSNGVNKKITGALNTEYTDGIELFVDLDAPATATSAGEQTLKGSVGNAVDLVTGVSHLKGSTLTINYRASATIDM